MMFDQNEDQFYQFNGSFYADSSNIKEEVKLEDGLSESSYNGGSGSESPHTLTDLNNMSSTDGCIIGDGNTFLNTDDSGYGERCWNDCGPTSWNIWQAQEWLTQRFPLNVASFAGLNGNELCQLTLEDCIQRDSIHGGLVYNELQQLQYSQSFMCPPAQQNYYPNFPTDFEGGEALDSMGVLLKAYSVNGGDTLPSLPPVNPPPKEEKPIIKEECDLSDEEDFSPPSPAESTTSDVSNKPGGRRNSKGKGKLWEFIRDLLLDSETCPSIIKWESRTDGIFRIVKSDHVAKLWGKRKGNASMTYEKMSRAMRYYYKKGVLERIECRRLVYKFGSSSRGWQL